MILKLENMTRTIKDTKVLEDVTLQFEGGKVYGVVGKEGSGKTMLVRAMCGLIRLDDGKISFDEKVLGKDISVLPVGLMLEGASLYPDMSAVDNLKYLTSINKKVALEEIFGSLFMVDLDPDDKRPLKMFSSGMRKRLTLAQAIFEDPDILIIDSMWDDGKEIISNIAADYKKKERIVIITCRNADEVKDICDEILIIEEGKVKGKKNVVA